MLVNNSVNIQLKYLKCLFIATLRACSKEEENIFTFCLVLTII